MYVLWFVVQSLSAARVQMPESSKTLDQSLYKKVSVYTGETEEACVLRGNLVASG